MSQQEKPGNCGATDAVEEFASVVVELGHRLL